MSKKIEGVILKDGEIIGEDKLFSENSVAAMNYYATVDQESIIYECPKKSIVQLVE